MPLFAAVSTHAHRTMELRNLAYRGSMGFPSCCSLTSAADGSHDPLGSHSSSFQNWTSVAVSCRGTEGGGGERTGEVWGEHVRGR